MSLHLTQVIHQNLQQRPNAVATVFQGRERTHAQLADRVARLAAGLKGLGVQPGDRVGLLSANSDRYVEMYLAVWWAGAAVNPINTRWSAAEIAFSLDDCETAVLCVDDNFVGLLGELKAQSSALKSVIHATDKQASAGLIDYEGLIAASEPAPFEGGSGDDLAGVFYTGGTTGKPKGVMLSHSALTLNALMLLVACPFDDTAVPLQNLPMFHLAGLSFLLRGLMRGCRLVILPGFTPASVFTAVAEHRLTHVMMVPTMLQMLADDASMRQYDLSSVVWVGYGASPISEAVLKRVSDMFPNAELFQGYGMTEVAAGLSLLTGRDHQPGDPRGRMRSAGQALSTVELRIVDPEGRALPLGEVGEIAARTPCLMKGYWNRPEETAAALREGWFRTGDAGRLDADGFLYIVDRVKDMIVSGGENVYSAEVENALARHPAVAANAVIGIPHERWGEQVHAVVVLKPGAAATQEELQAHCKSLIAGYKCPRSVEFRDALPLSGAGKILKTELRAPYWQEKGKQVA
jgi:acyl-CoA synthetase (AMP-forming)/AMP-acid ligase II